jgi:spore germination cell wall hydrolase CwlJ-like protein
MSDMKFAGLLIIVFLFFVGVYAGSENKKLHEVTEQVAELQQRVDNLTQQNEALQQEIAELIAEGAAADTFIELVEQPEPTEDKSNRGDDRPQYELSAEERDLVERVVMAESEDEPYKGKLLVCQCILNACRLNNKRPAAIITQYAYATRRPEPSESVRKAVAAVFDKGETVTDEPIIYFYAPALVSSAFHERQRFVTEVAGHRFFAEK